jgi:hypothetical protein
MVSAQWATLHIGIARYVGGVQYEQDVRKMLLDFPSWSAAHSQIEAEAEREIAMITREVPLGMHRPSGLATTINISGGIVGGVNLGTIVGDMNTAMIPLQATAGGEEVAQALKRLTEAVAAADELGEKRGEIIESLAVVTEEAALPPDRRKGHVVKGLLERMGPALSAVANLTQIWGAVYPLLANWFGLPK